MASVRSATSARAAGRRPGPLPPSVPSLIEASRTGLVEAATTTSPARRYAAAHLAALRAASAVLAARACPARRPRLRSVWEVLPRVAPALMEWAAFFAAGAAKRAAAEAGLPRAVTAREADDLVRQVEIFISLVEAELGLTDQGVLPLT